MKYPLLALLICFFTFQSLLAQESTDATITDKNELKLNAFNLIVFTAIDVSYERLINEESSFGVGLFVNVENDDVLDYYRTFSLTPYYRQFFSKSYAKGFFIEGFAMLNTGKDIEDIIVSGPGAGTVQGSFTEFALGISIGGKFVTTRGFVAEVYAGIGRNFLGADIAPEIVGRGGVSLGFRF